MNDDDDVVVVVVDGEVVSNVDCIWLLIQSSGNETNQPSAPAKPPTLYRRRYGSFILKWWQINRYNCQSSSLIFINMHYHYS